QENSAIKKQYSVVLADDDPIVREVVRERLASSPEFEVVGEAEDGRSAVEKVEKLHPDVLILDLLMPNIPGIEALRELASKPAQGHTIVFSSTVGAHEILQALQLGARGILSKRNISYLQTAIHSVLASKYSVEGREISDIASLLAELSQSMAAESQTRSYGL